jgi:glycosyltransferase involved in cell wall biosynthesis
MNILLSAYACEPGKGSEPGVGWNFAMAMARHHEVWVITRANNRAAIEAALAREAMPGVHFAYWDLPRWAMRWKRGRRGVHLYYYLWQLGIFRTALALHRSVHFDIVHHVTFLRYWAPSFLSFIKAPLVWGPLGGGDSAPKSFWRDFGWRGMAYEAARETARAIAERGPWVRFTAHRNAIALATTAATAARLRRIGARRVAVFSEVGLAAEEIALLAQARPTPTPPFRFVSLGNLYHLKGFHLGLRAFAAAGIAGAEYWLIGGGRERQRLERMAGDLGIADRVRFFGALPRATALAQMRQCHVLLHPVLHDSGGWAAIEAMAAGLPVICLDLGGPATQVTEHAGFKIPGTSPDQAVCDMAASMTALARDDALWRGQSAAASDHVRRHYCWDAKSHEVDAIYRAIADGDRAVLGAMR